MSVDVSRHYIIPLERLADALAAAVEVGPRTPAGVPLLLPDGSTVLYPFAPEFEEPPYEIKPQNSMTIPFVLRVAVDDELEKHLQSEPDDEIQVKRLKSGGKRAYMSFHMYVEIEPPYAEISFHNTCTRDSHLLDFKAVCDVLDYVGKCGDWIAVYERVMGDETLVSPFKTTIPPGDPDDDGPGLGRIVAFAERPNSGGSSMEPSPR